VVDRRFGGGGMGQRCSHKGNIHLAHGSPSPFPSAVTLGICYTSGVRLLACGPSALLRPAPLTTTALLASS
jgi:hypothetical protein